MKTKCDRCDQDATVTEVTVSNGQKVERHLCEVCAREAGIAVHPASLEKLMTNLVMQHVAGAMADAPAGPPKAVANACQECGLTFAEFRQKGLLGCPACFKAFEAQLAPMIERAHQGATHHCGKAPARAAQTEAVQHRLSALRKQLADAVAAEQYERAAVLRDELSRASTPPEPAAPAVARRATKKAANGGAESHP